MAEIRFGKPERRPVMLSGDVCEIWLNGKQIGTLFKWAVEGDSAAWDLTAAKQKLAEGFQGGRVEVRLINNSPSRSLQIWGEGSFDSSFIADGSLHMHAVTMKGDRLWLHTGTPRT